MGQRIYYHNITKNEYNINDFGDAVEQADKNDIRAWLCNYVGQKKNTNQREHTSKDFHGESFIITQ